MQKKKAKKTPAELGRSWKQNLFIIVWDVVKASIPRRRLVVNLAPCGSVRRRSCT